MVRTDFPVSKLIEAFTCLPISCFLAPKYTRVGTWRGSTLEEHYRPIFCNCTALLDGNVGLSSIQYALANPFSWNKRNVPKQSSAKFHKVTFHLIRLKILPGNVCIFQVNKFISQFNLGRICGSRPRRLRHTDELESVSNGPWLEC